MNLIAELEAEQIAALGKTIPDFKAGDTVRVGYKVTEGTRTRVQMYEGVCISRKGGETLGAEMLDWGRRAFGLTINEFYGQTECNMVASSASSTPTTSSAAHHQARSAWPALTSPARAGSHAHQASASLSARVWWRAMSPIERRVTLPVLRTRSAIAS